jgi:hypothetical protein
MYSLYLDKPTEFECDIEVKNASLKTAFARMIVESNDGTFLFKGEIKNGKCFIPIKKLKGLLGENTTGKMHLEVVVDDTYFVPWKDDFLTEEHTSVKVQIKEQRESSNKPSLQVKIKENRESKKTNLSVPAQELSNLCEKFDINRRNYKNGKRNDFKELVKEYFSYNREFKNNMTPILNEVITSLK